MFRLLLWSACNGYRLCWKPFYLNIYVVIRPNPNCDLQTLYSPSPWLYVLHIGLSLTVTTWNQSSSARLCVESSLAVLYLSQRLVRQALFNHFCAIFITMTHVTCLLRSLTNYPETYFGRLQLFNEGDISLGFCLKRRLSFLWSSVSTGNE